MAPRSSWKGHLRLSLVSVPVKAYTANETSEEIRFNQLHAECKSRIKYQKVCPIHGEVPTDQIVSGYEYAKDQYVIVDPDELAKLRREADHSVSIEGFIDAGAIDPVYFAGRTYYLAPDGAAGFKPFALLHEGMSERSACAFAKVIMAGREQLVLVRPMDKVLAMTFLVFEARIKNVAEFRPLVSDQELSKEEKALTGTLIEASRLEEFDLAGYKDLHAKNLMALIQAKVEGKQVVTAPDVEQPKILNLMDALKKSVAEAQAGGGARKTAAAAAAPASADKPAKKAATRKMAPSAGRKKAAAKRKSG